MRWMLILPTLMLAGCATPAPQIVKVPVPVSCVPGNLGPAPTYAATEDDLRAATPGRRYALAVGGFIERDQRLAEVEPVIAACRKAP